MNHSATFARHFARLVWLLRREPANVDEQKGALRALVTESRVGAVTLARRDGTIAANDMPVPLALSGVTELHDRMAASGICAIEADAAAGAADLLGVARVLAEVVVAVTGPTVRMIRTATTVALPDQGDLVEEAPVEPSAPVPVPAFEPPADVTPAAIEPAPLAAMNRADDGLFEQFAAQHATAGSPEALLEQLDDASGAFELTRVLDGLARLAEEAMREGNPVLASEIFHRIVLRERKNHDFESKRGFVLTVRRLSRGALLRAVAEELVRSPSRREQQMTVLARTGEDGADALIEQLASASGRSDRRVYFDALLELRAGVPILLHMLGDPRWFVARNAAALLGELQAREAEQPLGELMHHDDERVRHAATIALMRLGTPRSLPAIEHALRDGAPQIRMQAAAALVERREDATAAPLIRALDEEKDDEVKAAFLLALGRLGSPEAVERLIVTAQPERGFFRKKIVALRVAAVQALAAAGTPQALDALAMLQADKERDVQQAALHALTVAGNEAWGRADPIGP